MIRASEIASPVCMRVCTPVRVCMCVCVKWSYSAVLGMVSVYLENPTKTKVKEHKGIRCFRLLSMTVWRRILNSSNSLHALYMRFMQTFLFLVPSLPTTFKLIIFLLYKQ